LPDGKSSLRADMKFLAAIAIPSYALDQLTKWWIYKHYALIPSDQNIAMFPDVVEKTSHLPMETNVIDGWFQIVHWANTGAAFSIGSGNNWFFVVLSALTFIGLLVAWKMNIFTDAPSRWGVALLIGGILGNVTDRIVHGYVVDFLLFWLHVPFAHPWPAFNVADSCIFIAAGCFLVSGFVDAWKKRE
jgi:signal peptidase II